MHIWISNPINIPNFVSLVISIRFFSVFKQSNKYLLLCSFCCSWRGFDNIIWKGKENEQKVKWTAILIARKSYYHYCILENVLRHINLRNRWEKWALEAGNLFYQVFLELKALCNSLIFAETACKNIFFLHE